MSKFEYENPLHLYNSIKKMLKNRGFEVKLDHHSEDISGACEDFFFFLKNEGNAITQIKLGLREPIRVLTWITNQENYSSIDQYIDLLSHAVNGYQMIFANQKMIDGYESLYLQRSNFDPMYDDFSLINDKKVSKKFSQTMTNIKFKAGVYFLYNGSKKLIYVGKSKDLGGRIPLSVRERKATYYSYAFTKAYSDAGIYEMYYIAMLKPKLNVDGKFPDKPTINLPELEKTKITSIFSRKRGGVYGST